MGSSGLGQHGLKETGTSADAFNHIGARYDTMDPTHMEAMSKQLPNGQYLYLPEGSHLALYDDQQRFFDGLIRFLQGVA